MNIGELDLEMTHIHRELLKNSELFLASMISNGTLTGDMCKIIKDSGTNKQIITKFLEILPKCG